ncbi:hypothetical protein CRG98_010671 [Punica granatum]|uniref:Retrotransposon gag domain-containing protein n=1 Tax=Punica granatum TaxID=22663 RepID=A0A2I0KK81_PUNGR|nr:hypothetical protein CRG98_010671 [Punica granatum]
MDELRRQVQQLLQQLEHLQARNRDETRHGLDVGEVGEVNPFHDEDSDSSTERASPRLGRRNRFEDYGVKVDIPDFEGQMHPEDFIDRLATVERVFDFKNISEEKNVKLVAIKLKKHASVWWENLKRLREREGKRRIVTWEKMKRELKKKFLPASYKQDIFSGLYNFKQKELTVEEYTAEFEHLMMKCDIMEPEEQTIARYLSGLRSEIRNVLHLKVEPHPDPYKLSWLKKGNNVHVNKCCLVQFSIGTHYKDEIMCDVVPVDACHLLLGRP